MRHFILTLAAVSIAFITLKADKCSFHAPAPSVAPQEVPPPDRKPTEP